MKVNTSREEVFGDILQICEEAIKKWDEEEKTEGKDAKIRRLQAELAEEKNKPRRRDSSFSRMA